MSSNGESQRLTVGSMHRRRRSPLSFQPTDPHYVERVQRSFAQQPFMDFLGAQLIAVRPGYCEIHLPYKEELGQHHGFFHAGAIGTVADNAAGYAAYSLMDADSGILTVEFKLSLLSPGDGEKVVARGHVIKAGRQLSVCQSDVYAVRNGEETQCAVALVTLIQIAAQPGRPPLSQATVLPSVITTSRRSTKEIAPNDGKETWSR